MFVLILVPHLAPTRIVAVLLTAASVAARGLQMAVGERADPDIFPGRRNSDAPDAAQRLPIANAFAVRAYVAEGAA